MQARLPGFDRRRPPPPGHAVTVGGERVPLAIVRHRRARRYVLRVADDGALRLTVPRGASIAGGLRFAARQTGWIARERQRQTDRRAPWGAGTPVWFRGDRVSIDVEDARVRLGPLAARRASAGASVRDSVERALRALADVELTARCRALAAAHGCAVASVRVRNQRSRWGACSGRGGITLNWRLVQMPPHVSDYITLHELAHLRHPNHSPRFWREVERLCPAWREAERWIRQFGREIL